jgi:signal transduction histidine kinase
MITRQAEGTATPSDPGAAADEVLGVLHELDRALCGPLAALRDEMGRIVEVEPAPAGQRPQVGTMTRMCDDLIALSHSFVAYMDLLRGAAVPRRQTRALGVLLAGLDARFGPQAAARGLSWSCGLEGADVRVTTDVECYEQAVGHLIRNALAFTPTGGSVRVAGRADPETWSVTVSDSGPGIPDALLPRVFEPFVGLAPSDQPTAPGAGLGLCSCQLLAEVLGGQVTLEPGVDGGTAACLRLPLTPPRKTAGARKRP